MAALSPIDDQREFGFDAWCGPVQGMARPHLHRDVEFNRVTRGWVEYLVGGRRVRLEQGRLSFLWAAVPHQSIAKSADATMGWIVLPLGWLWRWELPGDLMASLFDGRFIVERGSRPSDAHAIARWSALLRGRDTRWRRIVELEIEARVRALVLHGFEVAGRDPRKTSDRQPTTTGGRSRDAVTLSQVERMAAFLSAHFDQTLEVADVAKHVALHPNYAMRLFRRHMGMTMGEYLVRQRVAEAQRRLMTTSDPILAIAHDSGCGSASRFHQAFRRLTGTTPARFRRETPGR